MNTGVSPRRDSSSFGDEMNIVLALAALSTLAFANAWVSGGALRSSAYESRQKLLQLALVWFLPLLGLGAVWALLREAENERCASERLTTDLADRGRSSIAVPDHVDLHDDAADLGGFGGH